MNTIIKRKLKIIRRLLRHNRFIAIALQGKITVNKLEGDNVNHCLKKSLNRRNFHRIDNSRKQRVTDMNDNDDKAWYSKADDNQQIHNPKLIAGLGGINFIKSI